MNRKLSTLLVAVGCVCLFGGCEVKYSSRPANEIETNWTKWSEPRITSDMWEGTTVWQTRTNMETGLVELRAQTASPKGNYYKSH